MAKILGRKIKRLKQSEESGKRKFYALDMFPYPSGAGLHVGHPEGYTATDIVSRMKRMQGYNVFIQWAGMHLVFLQNNMHLIPEMTQLNSRNKILIHFRRKLNHLVSPMTGIVKLIQQIQNIINGHNGFS